MKNGTSNKRILLHKGFELEHTPRKLSRMRLDGEASDLSKTLFGQQLARFERNMPPPTPLTFSVFDYAVLVIRRNRYLVVSAPEFGIQIAVGSLGTPEVSTEKIGLAVLSVLGLVSEKLRELELQRLPHPRPSRVVKIKNSKYRKPEKKYA